MKTRETIQIKDSKVIQPSQVLMVSLIILLSFAVGSIPLFFGLTTAKTNDVVPTEAGLWSVLGK